MSEEQATTENAAAAVADDAPDAEVDELADRAADEAEVADDAASEAADPAATEDHARRSHTAPVREHIVEHVVDPVREHVVDPVREHVVDPVREHVVDPVTTAVGHALGAANQAIVGRDAIVARRLRRQAREPLANLFELYPEARNATPREIGIRFVPLEEIAGTAVAGVAQRGGDFLPLRAFRSDNWAGRWQRIQRANERLESLPPVNLIRFGDKYWVDDGHNRIAAALYAGGAGVDAVVTELVPLDARISERPANLGSLLADAGELRAALFEASASSGGLAGPDGNAGSGDERTRDAHLVASNPATPPDGAEGSQPDARPASNDAR